MHSIFYSYPKLLLKWSISVLNEHALTKSDLIKNILWGCVNTAIESECMYIQSNLVISNSLISNYRLSRSENLVPVLTWNYDNR